MNAISTIDFLRLVTSNQGTKFIKAIRHGDTSGYNTQNHPYHDDDYDCADKLARSLDESGSDVYFTMASFQGLPDEDGNTPPALQRAANATHARAFWVDMDVDTAVAPDGSQMRPDKALGQRAAWNDIFTGCQRAGMPMPTHIISSGRGLHCYWLMDRDIPALQWKQAAEWFKAVLTAHGIKHDPSVTSDIARVLRVVGTHNTKVLGDPTQAGDLGYGGGVQVIWQAEGSLTMDTFVDALFASGVAAPAHISRPQGSLGPLGLTEGDMIEILRTQSPDAEYGEWFRNITRIFHETGGSQDGLDLAIAWSGSGHYAADEATKATTDKWDNLSRSTVANPSTFTSFLPVLREQRVRDILAGTAGGVVSGLRLMQSQVGENGPHGTAIGQESHLRPEGLGGTTVTTPLPVIAIPVQPVLTPMQEAKVALDVGAVARLALAERRDEAVRVKAGLAQAALEGGMPACLKDVFWDAPEGKFYQYESAVWYTHKSFVSTFKTKVKDVNCIADQSVDDQALHLYRIPHTFGGVFRPAEDALVEVVTPSGAKVNKYNTYPKEDRRPVDTEATPQGDEDFAFLKYHILTGLCGGDKVKAAATMDFLMWVLKNPGVRLGQCLYIHGASGIGKSSLAAMVERCYDKKYVSSVTAEQLCLQSGFNSFVTGGVLGVVHELKRQGTMDVNVAKAMKNLISENSVSVTYKGKEASATDNTMNWMIFTNDEGALRIEEKDRRFLYVKATWEDPKDLHARALKDGYDHYTDRLYQATQGNPSQLLYQARRYQFTEGFGQDAPPLETPEKTLAMSSGSGSSDEQAVASLFENCEEIESQNDLVTFRGITPTMASMYHIRAAFKSQSGGDVLKTSHLRHILADLKFKEPSKGKGRGLSYGGYYHAIWYKGDVEPTKGQAVQMLKDTYNRQLPETLRKLRSVG